MTTKQQQILAEIERRKRQRGKSYYLAMMELLSILDILPDEPVEKTCKTCGFYENNCPFIRDMKERIEQEGRRFDEFKKHYFEKYGVQL